jgi:peptidyl-prolyl cis-trans isomerase C
MDKENIVPKCVAMILFIGLSILPGQAQQSSTPDKPAASPSSPSTPAETTPSSDSGASSQKVVLKVGDAQVTEKEMEQVIARMGTKGRTIMAREGRRPIADEYIKMLVLSKRAIDEHLDSSPAIRSLLEQLRNQTLAEAEYEDMDHKIEVSTDEVAQYYAEHNLDFETIKCREFVVRQRPQDSNDPNRGLPPQEAKAKAEAIRKALLAGTDIEKVADIHGSFPNVQLVDRRMRYLRRDEMRPDLADATFAIKNSGVTEPVVTPDTIYVVKVFGRATPELKDVREEIVDTIKLHKLDAELEDMKKKAGVWMDEAYFSGHSLPKPTRPLPHGPAPAAPPKTSE